MAQGGDERREVEAARLPDRAAQDHVERVDDDEQDERRDEEDARSDERVALDMAAFG